MRRVILLAIGLAALLCAATARTSPSPTAGIATMSGVESCLLTGESHRSSDSDRHWRPRRFSMAAATDSVWKSAPVHAALAATRSARPFATAHPASPLDPPVGSAPPYLRHTPLLT